MLAKHSFCVQVLAYVSGVQDVEAHVDPNTFTLEQVESNPVRCPDPAAAELMYQSAYICQPAGVGPPPQLFGVTLACTDSWLLLQQLMQSAPRATPVVVW